jgi:hypothetical protein
MLPVKSIQRVAVISQMIFKYLGKRRLKRLIGQRSSASDNEEVEILSVRVNEHLEKMGFVL